MTSSSSIAPVWTPFRNVFLAAEVRRSSASLSGPAIDLYIIYKVRFSHTSVEYYSLLIASLMRPKISSIVPMPWIATCLPSPM